MGRRIRLPMYALAAGLLGLIVLLATLQYRWVAQISNAERERMQSTLTARATAFAQDFDRELTRAYLLFQMEPIGAEDSVPARLAMRYERWHATARYPKLIREIYVIAREGPDATPRVRRFDPSSRFIEPIEWPASLEELRAQLIDKPQPAHEGRQMIIRTIAGPLLESVPALLVPAPILVFNSTSTGGGQSAAPNPLNLSPHMSYTLLVLDREYMSGEMLPALAQQHFRDKSDGFDYQLAVVSTASQQVVYHSTAAFVPKTDAKADATAELFQVRSQEFAQMASEVRRFTALAATEALRGAGAARGRVQINEPMSIVVQQTGPGPNGTFFNASVAAGSLGKTGPPPAKWRLMATHPSGSLERAVGAARRRNLLVSSSILAVLGLSLALLVMSTRRAQELARQQMEFVAAVSHELRTPLAVIRSAGENLADGVVHDDGQIRKYGELVRSEGRRLSEMVEQILEFSGIQSGQRGFALRPVPIAELLRDVMKASTALIDDARMTVELDLPPDLPPALGDEPALRRVFQNLVGNAIKYGAGGGWIAVRARKDGNQVQISVSDRGPGIAPAEQPKIFDPFYRAADVVAAQIQGAGLGLSLVKRIVEAHAGRVAVKSAPGEGAEFTVSLPVASEDPIPEAADASKQNLPRYS